jgi:hypothetical protein
MTARAGRTYTLLLGIGAAGALIWLATHVGTHTTWRYWAALGLVAGAGLAFALTQRTAYGAWSEVTPLGFLLAFVVALVCIGWIAVVGQPHANWFRDHFRSWSHDIGILGFVERMITYVSVMAFGFGALLASAPGALGRPAPTPVGAGAVDEAGPEPARPVTATNGDGTRTVERERVGV